jgi:hypothetical protein
MGRDMDLFGDFGGDNWNAMVRVKTGFPRFGTRTDPADGVMPGPVKKTAMTRMGRKAVCPEV